MCAGVTMGALIDDERIVEFRHINFVGAQQVYNVELASLGGF